MATFTSRSKNSTTQTSRTKNSTTMKTYFRHGKEPRTDELNDLTISDIYYRDGTTLGELSVNDLADQEFTSRTKN